jgi:hypothetical protein
MKFEIEQIALYPRDPEAAIALLKDMGMEDWAHDHVSATGRVFAVYNAENEANLSFNYEALSNAHELEVLHYTRGVNWMEWNSSMVRPRVSHFGMHCTEKELEEWRDFFAQHNIRVAQEVKTFAHTNPVIAGKRLYHYVIFDTYSVLGVDIKFIIRHEV